MTKCPECGLPMVAAKENYPYEPVPGFIVTLHGITVLRDEAGHVAPSIPRILLLHRAIAGALVRKPGRLAGPEFRFLRTFMGYQAKELAPILGTSTFTMSRWETGKEPIGPQADRLVRTLAVLRQGVGEFDPQELAAIDKKAARPLELELRVAGEEWRPAA
jgi:DNA-binding transcriptional regulator YiaG